MSPLWPTQKAFGEHGVPAGDTVAVRRRQLVSRPGSGVESFGPWSSAREHSVSGVGLDRTNTIADAAEAPGTSRTQFATIFGPADADIQAGDEVRFPSGVVVLVEGIPDRSKNMFTGWRPPMSVNVRITHG